MEVHIRLTKGQRNRMYKFGPGVGFMAFKSAIGEITEIEFYTDPQGKVRRVTDGGLIFPLPPSREDATPNTKDPDGVVQVRIMSEQVQWVMDQLHCNAKEAEQFCQEFVGNLYATGGLIQSPIR